MVLALSLAVIIAVAAVAPALANGNQSDDKKSDSLTTFYGSGGDVILQLPSGVPSHPINLRFEVYDFNKESSFGAMDAMFVAVWVPAINRYFAGAVISDNPNPDFYAFAKTVLNGTPFWSPLAGMANIFQVADEELEVRRHGDVLMANLTKPINITLSTIPWGGNFTLPPIALEFRGIGDVFRDEASTLLPKPLMSGYTISQTFLDKPAWVRVWIAQWLGSLPVYRTVGTLILHTARTYIPPPA